MTVLVFPDMATYQAVRDEHPTLGGAEHDSPAVESSPGKRVAVAYPWEKFGTLDQVKAELADYPAVQYLTGLPPNWT